MEKIIDRRMQNKTQVMKLKSTNENFAFQIRNKTASQTSRPLKKLENSKRFQEHSNPPMRINPMVPIQLSTLGLIQDAFFDKRNFGSVTVGSKKYKR